MTANKFCGIVYRPKQGPLVHLPLDEVQVQALVIDVSAKVTLSQVFLNPSQEPTPRAKYVFPVPARAAVCAFEMRTEDGHVITGVAKEKEKAAREHATAIQQGKMTGLVEWATDDVFTISIGSIPANQKLTTKLTYTIDLMNDDLADQIRFQLPMCVGMRYGVLPDTMLDASNPSPSTRVRIVIGIQTKGNIQSVVSPSHPKILAHPFRSDDGEPSENRIIATYDSPDFLTQDFVVNVQAEGLDEPRCFAEKDDKHGSVAMQLTLVPKFKFPPIASQEYIFLVDRSGSMSGDRIETAKRTLVMLLRSLPASGTTFNIFSFGSSSSKMFPTSLEYSQSTLTSATEHVDAMSADYGGTEIRSALSNVFTSRKKTSPTAVFVLTDGETYDIDATIKTVTDAVSQAKSDAPLRLFTLGIGETTSTAMCEGIARAGNGVCLMATTSENILGKCAKLVRASRTFILKNISVDWGVPSEKPSKIGYSFRPMPSKRESTVLQSPSKIESIYSGLRLVITAMIKDEAFKIPQEVVLRAQRDGQGEPFEVRVPVEVVQPTKDDDTIPLVNTLAARRIITELEDPKQDSVHTEEQRKATIIRFGEEYQLASRYTSFVAVGDRLSDYQKGARTGKAKEKATKGHVKGPSLSKFVGNFFGSSGSDAPAEKEEAAGEDEEEKDEDEDWDFAALATPSPPVYQYSLPQSAPSYAVPLSGGGMKSMKKSRAIGLPKPRLGMGATFGRASAAPVSFSSAPAPLPSEISCTITQTAQTAPPPGAATVIRVQREIMELDHAPRGRRQDQALFAPPPPAPSPRKASSSYGASYQAQSTDKPVVRLVRLQAFDGSFTMSDEFVRIIGKGITDQGQGVNDTIWATALAIAYFRKHLADQPELLDGLVEKAMDFVNESPFARGVDFKALVEKAKGLV